MFNNIGFAANKDTIMFPPPSLITLLTHKLTKSLSLVFLILVCGHFHYVKYFNITNKWSYILNVEAIKNYNYIIRCKCIMSVSVSYDNYLTN